jgi:hypothetical protein
MGSVIWSELLAIGLFLLLWVFWQWWGRSRGLTCAKQVLYLQLGHTVLTAYIQADSLLVPSLNPTELSLEAAEEEKSRISLIPPEERW